MLNENNEYRLPKMQNVFLVTIIGAFLLFSYLYYGEFHLNEYFRSISKDQRFCVIVYKRSSLIFKSKLFNDSEKSGVVRLFDKQGQLLQEADVKDISRIPEIGWYNDRVIVSGTTEWLLLDNPVR